MLRLHASALLVKQGSGFAKKEGRHYIIPKREAFVFRLGDRFVGLLSLSCFGFCCRVGRPTMLRMLSNVFVSLGRNTMDATRAFGRSDAPVVALVLSIFVVMVPPPPTACIQLDCVIAGVGCAAVGLVCL